MISLIFVGISVIGRLHQIEGGFDQYISTMLGLVFQFYLWICVYSLFKELRTQESNSQATSLLFNKNYGYNYQTI